MIPPLDPAEDGFYRPYRFEKAPADMERHGQQINYDPLQDFSPLEGSQVVEIPPAGNLNPGDEVWLRVKARVKGSQSEETKKVALELSNFKVDDSPED